MSSTWLIYSGALMVLLAAGIAMVAGRPVMPAWRDTTAIAAGVGAGALVCVLGLAFGAPAWTAVSGGCFWLAATMTGTHALRGRAGSRG
ncbi:MULTISPECIES: hypothetical protein [Streptomyces]|uniref:hypothetical protein n=1 Tax=Streptomyces sp. SYP-A7185 TaxID=3040076 RepID=UPI0038F644D4